MLFVLCIIFSCLRLETDIAFVLLYIFNGSTKAKQMYVHIFVVPQNSQKLYLGYRWYQFVLLYFGTLLYHLLGIWWESMVSLGTLMTQECLPGFSSLGSPGCLPILWCIPGAGITNQLIGSPNPGITPKCLTHSGVVLELRLSISLLVAPDLEMHWSVRLAPVWFWRWWSPTSWLAVSPLGWDGI